MCSVIKYRRIWSDKLMASNTSYIISCRPVPNDSPTLSIKDCYMYRYDVSIDDSRYGMILGNNYMCMFQDAILHAEIPHFILPLSFCILPLSVCILTVPFCNLTTLRHSYTVITHSDTTIPHYNNPITHSDNPILHAFKSSSWIHSSLLWPQEGITSHYVPHLQTKLI